MVATIGLIVSVRLATRPLVPTEIPGRGEHSAPSLVLGTRAGAESTGGMIAGNPFRIVHRPVLPAYDPLRLAEQLAPRPPRPVLVLVGIVSSADPAAVVEGLPGVEGARVLRLGDVVAGLQVKQIGHGRAVIRGMDTTWVLEVREPWKN